VQLNEVITLPLRVSVLADPLPFIVLAAQGKRVLNVGASGGVELYLPAQRDDWLHQRLTSVARELVGIDIDQDSIAHAARHGVTLEYGDCETWQAAPGFDLIVMSDVIEHVNAPLRAIANLMQLLTPGGQLMITTPNPSHHGLIGRAWTGRRTNVYYDHVAAFLPEHFQAICQRLGLRLSGIFFFSHTDRRSLANRVKSAITRTLGRLVPRTHASFLVCLENGEHKP